MSQIINGVVVLAGVNPEGEIQCIDGTYLVAGLDPDGQPHVISVDANGAIDGGGSSLSDDNPANIGYAPSAGVGTSASRDDHVHDVVLTNNQAQLGADVAMPTANTFYDGPSLSLAAGIWLIMASCHFVNGSPSSGQLTMKLWDGTTVYSSADQSASGTNFPVQVSIQAIVPLSITTTVKASGTCNLANAIFKAAAALNGAGNNASTLSVVRIG